METNNQKNKLLLNAKSNSLKAIYQVGKLVGINNRVSILCFHSFSPADSRFAISLKRFEGIVEEISKSADFISLDDALKAAKGLKPAKQAVAITIDDGYTDALRILPITKKYNVPITLFVMPESKMVNRKDLGNSKSLLTASQIKLLHKKGWTIGCHSKTHTKLSLLSTIQIEKEIIGAKKLLEQKIGTKIKYYAYPHGAFNAKAIGFVKKAGFEAGFSTLPGSISKSSNLWALPRTVIEKRHEILEFPSVFSETTFILRRLTDPRKFWERIISNV